MKAEICLILVVCAFVFSSWWLILEPTMIINEVKSKLDFISPYDEYTTCYAGRDNYGWWSIIINVMDTKNGTEVINIFRYNSDLNVLKYNDLVGLKVCD